jgi:hypothetical protein
VIGKNTRAYHEDRTKFFEGVFTMKFKILLMFIVSTLFGKDLVQANERDLVDQNNSGGDDLKISMPRYIQIELRDRYGNIVETGSLDLSQYIEAIKNKETIEIEDNKGNVREFHHEQKKIDLSTFGDRRINVTVSNLTDNPRNLYN